MQQGTVKQSLLKVSSFKKWETFQKVSLLPELLRDYFETFLNYLRIVLPFFFWSFQLDGPTQPQI